MCLWTGQEVVFRHTGLLCVCYLAHTFSVNDTGDAQTEQVVEDGHLKVTMRCKNRLDMCTIYCERGQGVSLQNFDNTIGLIQATKILNR